MKKILVKIQIPLILTLLFGCSTTSNSKTNADLLLDYQIALKAESSKNSKLACRLFFKLYQNQNFILKEAALVHSLSHCPFTSSELSSLFETTTIPNYLKESFFYNSLKLPQIKKLPHLEAQFSFELSALVPIKSEKIKLLKKAIEIVQKLQLEEKIKIYTDRLYEISPSHNQQIDQQNIYAIAKDFELNRNFITARSLYQKIINEEFPLAEKVKAYNALRNSYKLERNLKTFLLKTHEMEDFLKKEMADHPSDKEVSEYWVDLKIALAKAVWTDHQNQKAKEILHDLIFSKQGTPNQKATTQLILGQLALEIKDHQQALTHFESAEKFKISDQNLTENIQWSIVWNHYLLKNDTPVIDYANTFIKKSNNQIFINKLNFWKAKSLLRLDHQVIAQEVFLSLIKNDPFGYYGILSSMELKIPLTPLFQNPISNDRLVEIPILNALVLAYEKTFAKLYLKEIEAQFKTHEEREMAMPLYYLTEWYQGGMRQIFNFKMSARNELIEKYINIIYPTPYQDTLQALNNKYHLPIELIWAIIRQESNFTPTERSAADAFGLMQIIPERALSLSKKFHIAYTDYNDLYNPEINLEMGAVLLKDLKEKYKHQFISIVAAYNAGGSAIETWVKERFNKDQIEFIEMIPYEETRNYIKSVFRNFITYKRMTQKKEFLVDKNFLLDPL